jgi:DNA-binding beta-propeller fold protein YncE
LNILSVLGCTCCLLLAVPASAALSIHRDEVVVAEFDRAVHTVEPGTGTVGEVSESGQFDVPFNVAISPDGQSVFVADQNANGGTIFRIDEVPGVQHVVVAGNSVNAVDAIAFGPDGKLYAARRSGPDGPAGIVRVDPGSGAVTPVSLGGKFDWPRDLEFASDGALYVLEALYYDGSGQGGPGAIVRVDLESGAQTVVTSGQFFQGVQGMGSAADGKIYVAQYFAFAQVLEVDIATGAQSLVTQGGSLCVPRDVAVERTGNLLVTDGCALVPCESGDCVRPAVIRVQRMGGAQSVVASGAPLGDLSGLVIFRGGSEAPVRPVSWGRLKAAYR